ncbi:MAG TPA: S8 family peptidase [Burkholderiaceae bacterium]|nr:S8 family peptidase [Burkholderiaceae bacterium]
MSATLAACALGFTLAGCGGGGSPAAPGPAAAPSCDLAYTVTDSPLLAGLDPLLGEQWHLRNTGQNGGTPGEDLRALDVWTASPPTRGEGVRVAVIDDAVETVHPDLAPNVVPGASFSYRPSSRGSALPLPCRAEQDDHGTAVAGLIAARDGNAIGGAGVAPRAGLVGLDALSTSLDADIADALGREREVNAVYNNSWGSIDNGKLHPAEVAFTTAIEDGLGTGRGGLGSVFVFPAGNGGCYLPEGGNASTCQRDNANFDGYVNKRGTIAVCAVDDTGRQPWYGEPGANVLVCAPSSGDRPQRVTTTALKGAYRNDFSGTSASTPMVSGVVALMLSAKPELSWRDVRLILAETARRNDPADSGWTQSPASGLWFNHKYGFGVADARAAVARARTWTTVGRRDDLLVCTANAAAGPRPIADAVGNAPGAPLVDAVAVAGCGIGRIEFVEVIPRLAHAYAGDLRITLESPSSTVSELADTRLCGGAGSDPCGAFEGWTFGSVRHLNEPSNGTWRLTVQDRLPADVGSLNGWTLRIHGRP